MIISWPNNPAIDVARAASAQKVLLTSTSRAGQISMPDAVLDRHNASVLRPAEAPLLPRQRPVRPTVYRTFVLLIRSGILTASNVIAINDVLADVGMSIDVGDFEPDPDRRREISQPVGLRATAKNPGLVDAWRALQTLRFAKENGKLPEVAIEGISLDHLLFGSAATGVGLGVVEGVPGMGNGNANGPGGDTVDYGYWPDPVALAMTLPPRHPVEDLPGKRRVVVAVLDTGLDENEPLGVRVIHENGTERVVGDSVRSDPDIQRAVFESGSKLESLFPNRGIEPITGLRDVPFTTQPLIGDLATHTGHGTFITGIIRQAAPDADVLAIRTLHSDGAGYQIDAIAALSALLDRVEEAQQDEAHCDLMVDIVSLSWGCFDESPDQHLTELAEVIGELRRRGVIVVAAAGNYATDRPFYPAALSRVPETCHDKIKPAPVPVIGVSALNPNGSKAIYANEGKWVSCWATGTAVISTFPQRINAARNPSLRIRTKNGKNLPQTRETLDGDDHASGYRKWGGTSFAAPFVAAELAEQLQREGLSDHTQKAARARAWQAVNAVRAKWADVRVPINGQ